MGVLCYDFFKEVLKTRKNRFICNSSEVYYPLFNNSDVKMWVLYHRTAYESSLFKKIDKQNMDGCNCIRKFYVITLQLKEI